MIKVICNFSMSWGVGRLWPRGKGHCHCEPTPGGRAPGTAVNGFTEGCDDNVEPAEDLTRALKH